MMVVPLIARKELLGVLSLLVRGERRCTQHSLALATGLAWRAALVIDNSRLLAVRQQSVSDLQHGLLPPRLPAVAGVDVGGHYQPVAPDLLVGGDFYDFFAVGGGWGFMIGDICGKGASAARMTGLVRHTARALAAAGVDQFGPDRLAATAVALAGDSSAAIAMGLTEAVLRFAAAEIADDIAVLVLTPRDGVPGAGRGVLADGISA
jgi:serine phosphatase RsbU (regulator of sigma subunit)